MYYRIISVRVDISQGLGLGKCFDCAVQSEDCTNSQIVWNIIFILVISMSRGRTSHALCTCINTGGGSATVKYSKHERKKMSKEKKIGHIRVDGNGDATVKMGTPEEAVVGIKMLPISTLITHPELRRKVVATTKLFFETSQDYSCKLTYMKNTSRW